MARITNAGLENVEGKMKTKTKKRCPKCTRTLPVDSFSKNVTATDGLQGWCRDCNRDAAKNRLARNRARNLAQYAETEAEAEAESLAEDAAGDVEND